MPDIARVVSRGRLVADVLSALPTYLRASSPSSSSDDGEMDRLRAAIATAAVVSFDVFDTLITRVVDHPDDVHGLTAALGTAQGLEVPDSWPSMRMAAERHARRSSTRADITLEEIYSACSALVERDALDGLRALEVSVERTVARPTSRGAALYRHARESGRTIVLSSDMYLPKYVIEEILSACGYAGWQKLVVSGDDGVSKWRGSMFDRLKVDYSSGGIIHIGDNPVSDVVRAHEHGILGFELASSNRLAAQETNAMPRARWVRRRVAEMDRPAAALVTGTTRAWYEGHGRSSGHAVQIGYSAVGPALLGFSQHLQETAVSLGATRLHFLAREGAILKSAYEATVPEEVRLDSTYALLSTRVTGMAALSPVIGDAEMRFLCKTPVPLPARALLARIFKEAAASEIDDALRAAGVNPSAPLDRDEATIRLRSVFNGWNDRLQATAAEQRGYLSEYLEDLGMRDTTETPLVVDVGWAGSIQRAIAPLCGPAIGGVYFGVIDTAQSRSIAGMHGWIDARRGGGTARSLDVLFENLRVLEVLFASPGEGSIRSFARVGSTGPLVPEMLANEFPPIAKASIAAVQEGALQFIRDFRAAARGLGPGADRLPTEVAVGPLLEMLEFPTGPQLRALSQLPFDGTYGVRPERVGIWGAPARLRADVQQRVKRVVRRGNGR